MADWMTRNFEAGAKGFVEWNPANDVVTLRIGRGKAFEMPIGEMGEWENALNRCRAEIEAREK